MNFDDAAQRLVELAASRHNAFHTSEAADIGIPPDRLRRARGRQELIELRPKVWAVNGGGASERQTLRAAVLARSGSAAMGRSAAWLHGWTDDPPAEPVLWAPPKSRAALSGSRVRRIAAVEPGIDVVEVDRIRCLNKAATLCLLGEQGNSGFVERCLDEFLRTESATWLDQTVERMVANGASGCSHLVKVMRNPKRVRGATDSWMERVVAQILNVRSLPRLSLQHRIEVDGGHRRVDLAFPDVRLGIEAHSRTFHWGPGKEDADNVRDLEVASAGWQLLYVTWAQLHDPERFADQVVRAVKARSQQFGPSGPAVCDRSG